jgi:antitoxin component of MazEF toxin-antitoxin module
LKTRIVSIGNSLGIRIPKLLLKQSGLAGDVELRAEEELRTVDRERLKRRLGALSPGTLHTVFATLNEMFEL